MRYIPLLFLLALASVSAQTPQNTVPRPKLIVGIVVDQMRYDFLYRYQAHYGANGFNRLLEGGFSCENTHFNFVPTYTGPGHAAIYSGTTPSLHGIIGNDWWDPEWRAKRYCTADKRFSIVGGTSRSAPETGQHSPASLLSSTITDELRLSNNFRSKVAAVCLKDRGSILPAGHIPNACYWFDDASGNWITSSYYPDSAGLQPWVRDYNARRWPDTFLQKTWELGHAPTESFANWNFVGKYGNLEGGFPHDFAAARAKGGYGVLRFTPYGNTLVTNFAIETINKMELGADEWPDLISISYSPTDYCAHQFGIHAEETEDMYVRLDRELARLLDFLDKKFGKSNVLVFLTADHGGAETPAHMNRLRIPAGVFAESKLEEQLEKALSGAFGLNANFIQAVENQQIWLNWDALNDFDLKPEDVALAIGDQLRAMPGVYDVLTRQELELLPEEYPFVAELRRGIHPRRSGDLIYVLDPAWHADDRLFATGGTTHGSQYAYDTHVPLLWYGWKIQPGETFSPVSITDIAPTLAAMLRIMEPNATTGKVIEDLLR
jgi:predicted AlkP superfamily pyrophosphatase or phosphodiesterase